MIGRDFDDDALEAGDGFVGGDQRRLELCGAVFQGFQTFFNGWHCGLFEHCVAPYLMIWSASLIGLPSF
ncbi:hypothetical protein D3C71_2093160 [compost metagenome]